MKKLMITVLMTVLVVGALKAQKANDLNKEAWSLMEKAITSDDYLLKNVFNEIRRSAEAKWEDDYEMIIYHINEESKAFLKVVSLPDSDKQREILLRSMVKWGCTLIEEGINVRGADWRMVLYTYEKQNAAYLVIKKGNG